MSVGQRLVVGFLIVILSMVEILLFELRSVLAESRRRAHVGHIL